MHIQKIIIYVAAIFLLGGCVSTQNLVDDKDASARIPSRYAMPTPIEVKAPPQEGTIYSESFQDIYRDSRAREVGDIVLVKIIETSSGSKKAETTTERSSTVTGGIASLFGFEKWLADKNARFTPSKSSIDASLTNDFEGTGETKRDSQITATISARVIDKTIDGNLIIRGFREIRLNDETQHIIVSGLVRPGDIATDNSILSTLIADARIEYGGVGIIAEKQQPGWLARGLDVVWPF